MLSIATLGRPAAMARTAVIASPMKEIIPAIPADDVRKFVALIAHQSELLTRQAELLGRQADDITARLVALETRVSWPVKIWRIVCSRFK